MSDPPMGSDFSNDASILTMQVRARDAPFAYGSGSDGSDPAEAVRMLDGEILEPHVLLDIHQCYLARWAVALLGDDDVDQPFLLVLVVKLGAMQHHYGVRVLLNGAGFAQVAKPWLLFLAVLQTAIDLSERDDRNLQLASKEFQSPGNPGNLFLAVLAPIIWIDELQIVDDDKAQIMALFQPSGIGGDSQHILAWGIIDEEFRFAQDAAGFHDFRNLFMANMPFSQPL